MNSLRMLDQDAENDDAAEVTWEDQQRINSFSKLNTRLRNMQEKLHELEQEKDALKDLADEFEMILDEDEPVLYKVGETFLHMPLPRARKRLEKDQAEVEGQVNTLSSSVKACEKEMQELKIVLYAKFGRAINLD
ncbi:Prefoldin subunit-domain-containing protein [Mycena pura]|uniref:Prefoldin subunit 4 n=1 Tax=Mycena pura TaxID=153505 RepID=A0AAD6VR83_9AGAR|nr:Prefoldin subunit-domain-containing protein [Mycena pura]